MKIVSKLTADGALIKAFDPEAMDNAREVLTDVTFSDDSYEAAKDADALLILTEWNQFRKLDLDRIKDLLKEPIIIDLRNVYKPVNMSDRGFKYFSVGR
jgi:UDPglucose 6-dehydrogenase